MTVVDVVTTTISMTKENNVIFMETGTKETILAAMDTNHLTIIEAVVETASETRILSQVMNLVMTQTKEADLILTEDIDASEEVKAEVLEEIEEVDSETEWVETITNKTSMANMVKTMVICVNKRQLAGIEAEAGARSDMKRGYYMIFAEKGYEKSE